MTPTQGANDDSTCALSAVDVSSRYGKGDLVLDHVSLGVRPGDFCTILGPSGSGKTSLLRIVAGLMQPESGEIWINGVNVTLQSIQSRNIGFAFQHYALFPHLTVEENISYSLKVRGHGRAKRSKRSMEMLELVDLVELKNRLPGQLSGGQQQRVAIARALAFSPQLLLLDEPLGALDRRLRQRLGQELRRIQQETGVTAVYVTHDQEEAFLLSDHLVVMNHGVIAQQGQPDHLYATPSDRFVASFLGDTNVLPATYVESAGDHSVIVELCGSKLPCRNEGPVGTGNCSVSIRPEDVALTPSSNGSRVELVGFVALGEGHVSQLSYRGDRYRVSALTTGGSPLVADVTRNDWRPGVGDRVSLYAREGALVALPE